MSTRYFIGVVVLLFLIFFSAAMATYVISGLLLFAGLVALSESIPAVKWLFRKTSNVVDFVIFAFSIYAMSSMGVTVAIGLGVAGLLFSLYYKPYLVSSGSLGTKSKDGTKSYRSSLWEQ
jgi:hypothetical protein